MQGIGIIPNWKKEKEVRALVARIAAYLQRWDIEVYLPDTADAPVFEGARYIPPDDFAGKVNLFIVLGGDGTILRVARQFAGTGIPLLGVNLGQMGFLAEVEPPMLEEAMQLLLDGKYKVCHRLMLSARVLRKDRQVAEYTALNDIIVGKAHVSRIIYVDTYINDKHLETYPCDGLIVATPTGSTGYSLSAGGPLVNPALDVMIITPICPHLLHHRSVVVASTEMVSLQAQARQAEVMLTVDGQVTLPLEDNDVVHVTRASLTTPLIQLQGTDFYTLLHRKLMKVIHRERS